MSFQYRATDGAAAVVNATRAGANFTAYDANNNAGVAGAWQQIGTTQAITFAAAPNAFGLAVTSKVDATVCTAVFDRPGGTVKRGGERTITLTPTTGVPGSATVTLNVSDGPNVLNDTIAVMAGPTTAPTIFPVSNINITDGATIAPFVVTLNDVHTPVGNLTFTVTTSNSAILPASAGQWQLTIPMSGAPHFFRLEAP